MSLILVLCAHVCRWCWWSINTLMNNDASGRTVIFCNNTTTHKKGEPYGDLAFIQTLFCILMMKHFTETSSCLILLRILQMQGDKNEILKKNLTIVISMQKLLPDQCFSFKGCSNFDYLFRSAFRMPTSRSYPRHLVQFREKEKKKKKHFTSLQCLKGSQGFPRVPKGSQGLLRVTKGY